MIDTHSHLFDEAFIDDIDECVNRCIENNINKVILVGFSKENNHIAQEYAEKYKIFYPTAGIHPENVEELDSDMKYLEDFIKNNKVYAVGECGLDYHWRDDNKELQKLEFKAQIEMAIKYNLPIIIHSRDSIQDTYDILKEYKGKIRGVMHCYSGSYEMALEFIKLGLYIGFDGPVTFKNSKEPKRIAASIPLDRILIETDCPYLTPVPYRGKRNESSYVRYVCEEIASLRGIALDEMERITDNNAIELFKIWGELYEKEVNNGFNSYNDYI